jgi:hypothetical protein
VAIDWAAAYEAPTSLDAERMLGTRRRRSALWTLGAAAAVIPVVVACFVLLYLGFEWAPFLAVPLPPWLLVCYVFGADWGGKPFEHWLRVWWHSRRLPHTLEAGTLVKHHVALQLDEHRIETADGLYGAVVEVSTINLRMADNDTLGGHIKRLHAWYVGLRWPVQIVVRAWRRADGLIVRRWFVAVQAESHELLEGHLADVLHGLKRAGLEGRPLNGDLFETLQTCWSHKPPTDRLGPFTIKRARSHVIVDGEYVRGFVLTSLPRIVEPNWLASLMDGDLPVDLSLWLEPIENADELQALSDRINEWETAQVIYFNRSGYRDPDIDDYIRDAKRTREQLRRPGVLRVFRAVVGIAVRAQTEKGLADIERLVIDQLREHIGPGPAIPIDWEQDRTPLIGVPTGAPPVYYPIRVVTPALARSHPFSNSSLTMTGGVPCGTSTGSQRENTLNLWTLTNPHMDVLATSGAGKGYWVKVFILRVLRMFPERHVWIIQAEKDEYTTLADAAPTHHFSHPDLPSWHRGAVIRITSLAELDGKLWTHKPGWLAGEQLTVYDLTQMPADDRGTAIAEILHAIEQAAERDSGETWGHVVIDELGIVLRSPEAAAAIEIAYRRFRSIPHRSDPHTVSRRGMIGISQRPSDLLANKNGPGKVIADLAETHVYLKMKSTELKVVRGDLNLTPEEADYLELAAEGDGLLTAGRVRVGFHLYATPEEHEVART